MPPGTLTALDVRVDSHDVVHQMNIQLLGSDGQTTLTVTFTDFGQPQSITAPATSNPVPASPERWLGAAGLPRAPRPTTRRPNFP